MVLRHTLLLTVVGPLLAVATERGLLHLGFLHEAYEYRLRARALARRFGPVRGDDSTEEPADQAPPADARRRAEARQDRESVESLEDSTAFDGLVGQLGEFFCGRRRRFEVPLDLRGTPFQVAVWRRLQRIPYGQLRSYGQVAEAIGRPQAARAVGQAVGNNPVSIVVPCHRVIGSNGGLVGFGGGMTLKAQLLRLEGHTLGETPRVVEPRLF